MSRIKKAFTENIGLKLLSVVSALILWLVIVNSYDPVMTKNFTLNVTMLNGDVFNERNKVYEVVDGTTTDIQVRGKTSIVNDLKVTDFKATADISKLSPTMHASINVVCTKSNEVEITFTGGSNLVTVVLEDLVKSQFKVSVDYSGTAMEGYYVGSSKATPNLIEVSGAESVVNKIASVRVEVNIDGATETFSTIEEPIAYDTDGNEISGESLSFSVGEVSIATNVFPTKEIPVTVVTTGIPYTGYEVGDIAYEPQTITVAGETAKLAAVESIQIPVDVSTRITDLEAEIPIQDYLPEEIYLTGTDTGVNVRISIVRLQTKELVIPRDLIELRNTDTEHYTYTFPDGALITVRLNGRDEDLKDISAVSLAPYIDASGIVGEGEYSMSIGFGVDGLSATIENTPIVQLRVTRIVTDTTEDE